MAVVDATVVCFVVVDGAAVVDGSAVVDAAVLCFVVVDVAVVSFAVVDTSVVTSVGRDPALHKLELQQSCTQDVKLPS